MPKIHNLDYYSHAYETFLEFRKQQHVHSQWKPYMNPPLFLSNFCTHLVSYLPLPSLKQTYSFIGACAIKTSWVFSKSLSEKIDDLWHDPIDTKILLVVGKFIQRNTKWWASRKHISVPLLGRLDVLGLIDKCTISFARHLHVMSKDLNVLLRIPDNLHSYLGRAIGESDEGVIPSEPTTYLGKGWQLFKIGTRAIKDAIVALILKIIHLVGLPFKYVPLINRVSTCLENIVELGRVYLHSKVVDRAHQIIESKEKIVRRKVLGLVAEKVAQKSILFFTSLALTTAAGVVMYYYAPQFIYNHTPPNVTELAPKALINLAKTVKEGVEHHKSLALLGYQVLGGCLWLKSISPIFYGLHESYKEDFDPDASTLWELTTLINGGNIFKVYKFLKNLPQ